jgi:energy-coupling factor transporter ATP-binding protein EcfA2
VYLKSLQLRGFKSFADTTRLDFEPGITVIVGPNGSGKSNIVDALTWSMGTRSAKDLRGGQMADVIFAGARSRNAMGRASVEITIDNTDESLPIEFSEVTVGRSMFATGENAYSINDVECRQLDVADPHHRRPGPHRRGPQRPTGGTPRLHRGGRRHPQAPPPQGTGVAQARADGCAPGTARRRARGDAPPAASPRAAGRGRPEAP